jgi:hypothetical protein
MSNCEEEHPTVSRSDVMDPEMVRILRAKSDREKFEIGAGMWRSARDMLRNYLRGEHPQWSNDQVDREVARRLASGND